MQALCLRPERCPLLWSACATGADFLADRMTDCAAGKAAHNKIKGQGQLASDPFLRRSRADQGAGDAMIDLEGVASVADVARVQALRRGSAPALLFEGDPRPSPKSTRWPRAWPTR